MPSFVEREHEQNEIAKAKNTGAATGESSGAQSQPQPEKRNLKDLAEEIVVSYDARVRIVGDIIADTHQLMDDFKEKRGQMSKALQAALARSESLRKKDFSRMMADIIAKQNEREREVKEMLEDFRKEEEMVAGKLRAVLGKGEKVRIKDFKKMMADIRGEQGKRAKERGASISDELNKMRQEVYVMLDNFKKERQSVASAWHEVLNLFRLEDDKHKEK